MTWSFYPWPRRPGLPPVRITSHHTDSVDDSTKPGLTLWRHDFRLTAARTCLSVFLAVFLPKLSSVILKFNLRGGFFHDFLDYISGG